MAAWPFTDHEQRYWAIPGPAAARWLETNDSFRRDVLTLLRKSGPLLSRDIPDTSVEPWQSSRLDRQPQRHPDAGVPVGARRGRHEPAQSVGSGCGTSPSASTRRWTRSVPLAEARRAWRSAGCASLGIARPEVVGVLGERRFEDVAGEPAEVEGTEGEWRVDPEAIGQPFEGRTALLSPFDRLVHDRERAAGAVRLRVHARDVQAHGAAPLGLLRAPRAARGPARRQGRRDGRSQAIGAGRPRHPRGRPVHAGDHEGGAGRARRAGVLARPQRQSPCNSYDLC